MTTAYVILTALPPTKGHTRLVEYASWLADEVVVLLSTQPEEPMVDERFAALDLHFYADPDINVRLFNHSLPQDPSSPGFREMWATIMKQQGVRPSDLIVGSESYGVWLAEMTDARFMPYDPGRELTNIKATNVREDPWHNFDQMIPHFQNFLRVDVVVWGAESTGKTTLSKDLAAQYKGHWFFEWARPYLETVGTDITVASMTDIWQGQRALEMHASDFHDKPISFYDTDLFSTIGYWQQPHWAKDLGPVPAGLFHDAVPADLYLITRSNIPFEADPLRYGGDHRESGDQYWIDIAEQYGLNYVVLESNCRGGRISEAARHIDPYIAKMRDRIAYDRGGF